MNVKNLTYNEFMLRVGNSNLLLDNLIPYYRNIARFFYENNENACYVVKGLDGEESSSSLEVYKEFGLFPNNFVNDDYSKIAYINPSGDLLEQYNKEIQRLETTPTHVVVLSEDKQVVSDVVDYIKANCMNPGIVPMQTMTSKYNYKSSRDKMIKTLKTDRIIDLTPYCLKLNDATGNMENYIKMMDDFVEEIHSKNSNHDIYVYLGEEFAKTQYFALVVELYLRYGDRFYCNFQEISSVRNAIVNSCFNYDYLLVEEFCSCFDNLPRVFTRDAINSQGNMYYVIKDKSLKFNIRYINYEDSFPEYKEELIDYSSIKVVPLESHLNMETESDCDGTKSYIMDLYKSLGLRKSNKILTVLDLIMFEYKGKLQIGVVENFELKVQAISIMPGFSSTEVELAYHDLLSCLPTGLYLNGMSVSKKLLELYGITFDRRLIEFKRTNRKFTNVLRTSSLKTMDIRNLYKDEKLDLVTLGINCAQDANSRFRFNKTLTMIKGIDFTRRSVDCFGGFNPVLKENLVI